MEESKPKRSPWLIGLGLFFVGLVTGGAVIGAGIGLNSASSSIATVTIGNNNAPALKVLATFFPLQNWAAAVGGDRANVLLLVPVSIDVHDFEPGPADLEAIAQANVLVLNGAGLEPWASAVLAAAGNPNLTVVNCSLGISLIKVPPEFQAGDRTIDPHVWNDPVDHPDA
jgi:zinc transport system substrate-binding protein